MADDNCFSNNEKEALIKFRQVLSDVLTPNDDNHSLIAWLRARKLDVRNAEAMFRESLAYRKAIKAEDILNTWEPPEVAVEYLPTSILGHSKDSYPVFLVRTGRWDILGMKKSMTHDDFIRLHCYVLELVRREIKGKRGPTGNVITQYILIHDMDGFRLSQLLSKSMLDYAMEMIPAYEDNFPEFLKDAFIINVPPFFEYVFNKFKYVINADTLKKVHVYGRDSSLWKGKLLEVMDASVLPVAYGGTRTDPDGNPECNTILKPGGIIPESYYLGKLDKTPSNHGHLKTATLKNGEVFQLNFDVTETEQLLRWELYVTNWDIDFTVQLLDECGNGVIILQERISSNMGVTTGELDCEKAGKYVVSLDNSHSILRSKTVHYNVSVVSKFLRTRDRMA